MEKSFSWLTLCPAFLAMSVGAHGAIIYTQDTNISNLTNGVTNYATFISGTQNDGTTGDTILSNTVTYTPTSALLNAPGYDRVVGQDATPPVIVKFATAQSRILVFSNLDHVFNHTGNGNGSFAWDAYQWNIYGSNDDTNFTLLFDPQTAIGTDDPTGLTDPHYTLGTWGGAFAPTLVNNATSSILGFAGRSGYEMYFDFGVGNTYQYYGFRESSLSRSLSGEVEEELSAVAQATPTPEPITGATMLIGFSILGFRCWRVRQSPAMIGKKPSI